MWGGAFARLSKSAGDFLNSDLVEKARKAATDVADAARGLQETVEAEYRKTFVELDCQIYTIRPDTLVMEHPSEDKIDRLAARLNTDYPQRMLIYNMSERKYDTTKFQGEVVDVAFRGLPAPPIELLMELCLSAHNWLTSDVGNVLLVHCFQGYSRSAVFLSCLLAFRGFYAHPVDALHEVCAQLGIDDASAIVPSQRRYLTYFQQCQQGLSPADVRVRLSRVQLSGVPRFETEGDVAFRPYIEVWNHGELVYTSFARQQSQARPSGAEASGSGQAAGDSELPKGIAATEPCACFQLPPEACVAGDVLIRVRHVYLDGSRDTALRVAFHTGFVSVEGLQLARRELDSACSDSRFPEDSFLDVAFDLAPEAEGSDARPPAQAIFEKARGVSQRLREEAKAAEAKAAAEALAAAAAAAKAAADAKAAAPPAKPAAEAKASGAAQEAGTPKKLEVGKVADVEDEIDQLFDEFDDALDSVVLGGKSGGAGKADATPAAEAKTPVASLPSGDSSPPADLQPKAASAALSSSAIDDVFAEADDFLKDPLAALEPDKAKPKQDGDS